MRNFFRVYCGNFVCVATCAAALHQNMYAISLCIVGFAIENENIKNNNSNDEKKTLCIIFTRIHDWFYPLVAIMLHRLHITRSHCVSIEHKPSTNRRYSLSFDSMHNLYAIEINRNNVKNYFTCFLFVVFSLFFLFLWNPQARNHNVIKCFRMKFGFRMCYLCFVNLLSEKKCQAVSDPWWWPFEATETNYRFCLTSRW